MARSRLPCTLVVALAVAEVTGYVVLPVVRRQLPSRAGLIACAAGRSSPEERERMLDVLFNNGEHFNGNPIEDRLAPAAVKMGWHIDFPFLENPPSYTSMHMTKCDYPAGIGRTWLMDLEQVLLLLPSHFIFVQK